MFVLSFSVQASSHGHIARYPVDAERSFSLGEVFKRVDNLSISSNIFIICEDRCDVHWRHQVLLRVLKTLQVNKIAIDV